MIDSFRFLCFVYLFDAVKLRTLFSYLIYKPPHQHYNWFQFCCRIPQNRWMKQLRLLRPLFTMLTILVTRIHSCAMQAVTWLFSTMTCKGKYININLRWTHAFVSYSKAVMCAPYVGEWPVLRTARKYVWEVFAFQRGG